MPPEIRCERVYGSMYHHLYTLKEKLNKNLPCMHEGCSEKCEKRALVNIWGTVYEVDLCSDHYKEWDSKCTEDFPFRKP